MKPTTTHSQNSWLKKLFLLIITVCTFQTTHAQVTIPDPNFAAFLQMNYPAAMTGNVLDEQHPSVTGAMGMFLPTSNLITDFTGLDAFVNLQMLSVTGDFTSMPQLANLNFVTDLEISQNSTLTVLPNLPPNLINLTCVSDFNLASTSIIPSSLKKATFALATSLTTFPPPPALEELYLDNCSAFSSLTGIPNSLRILYLGGAPVAASSINFASTQLTALYILNNNLTSLPALPSTLKNLDCSINQISSLAGLPTGLLGIACSSNNLTTLGTLPTGLTYLDYSTNNVTTAVLPTGITELHCTSNGITCLPDLPPGLQMLYANSNPATCLPYVPSTLTFSDIGFNLCNNMSVVTTNPTCNDSCSGTVTASFDSGEYNYIWSNGVSGTTQPNTTSLNFDSLCTINDMMLMITPVSGGCSSTIQFDINGPALTVNILSITNVSCNGSSDGIITADAQNGTPPYMYAIDGGALIASGTFSNVPVGNHVIQAQDALGCTGFIPVTVTQPSALSLSLSTAATLCATSSDGAIAANVSGGTPSYMYSIDGGVTFQSSSIFNGLAAGSYSVIVRDANNCTATSSASVISPPPLTLLMPNDTSVCGGSTVNLCGLASGGTVPYTYLWSNLSVIPCQNITSSGTYILIVTDISGCTATDSVNITFLPAVTASVSGITLPTCGACDGIATINVTGNAPFLFQLEDSSGNSIVTLSTVNTFCESENYIWHVVDANGCEASVPVNIGCTPVWPGDANYDGVADNMDLLAVGTGYGTTGAARPNATINWQPETGISWHDALPSTVNYKHIDCNGNGLIEDDDTTAIIQNFSQVHALRPFTNAGPNDPQLYFDIQVDTTNTSSQLSIPLVLGTSLTPATDIYGIAFTVNYDTTLIKADSVSMDYSNCWLAAGHKLSLAVNDPVNGRLYGAVTRTSHSDTTGFGTISTMGIVTVDNISARLTTLISDTLIFTLSNVSLIDYAGSEKNINLVNDTMIINGNTTGIHYTETDNTFQIYPNPAGESFLIRFAQELSNAEITMYSITSKKMQIDYKATRQNALVNCSAVRNGLYIVVIKSDEGIYTEKIEIRK